VPNLNDPKFSSQFLYWSCHALFCATPSFVLAIFAGYQSATAIAAMLSGIATFIALYALFTSSKKYQERYRDSLFGEAVRIGAKLRSAFSLFAMLWFFTSSNDGGVLVRTDMYAGMIAIKGIERVFGEANFELPKSDTWECFYRTYLTTVLDGLLLSGTLFAAVFFCFVFLKVNKSPQATK